MDQACRAKRDVDLGSAGPIVLPKQPGSVPNELVIAGKGGDPCDQGGTAPIYLLNQVNLGKYDAKQDQIVETVAGSVQGYWSNPAYWQGQTATNLYMAGVVAERGSGDYLKMYSVSQGRFPLPRLPRAQIPLRLERRLQSRRTALPTALSGRSSGWRS